MKRYWKLAVLVPLIVVCIGFYYTKVSGSNFPEYVLKMQEGNEKEASSIVLGGSYGNQNESVFITSEGTEYSHERPFWSSWNGNNPILETSIKKNRDFMRGKTNPFVLYEDDEVLGYGDVKADFSSMRRGSSNFRFTVSLYDKKRKDTSSFEVKVPNEERYNYINVRDVRVIGKTMKLFTYNEATQNTSKEAHLYTLDLEKKSVMEDQVILSAVSTDQKYPVGLEGIYSKGLTKENGYHVFVILYPNKEPSAKAESKGKEFFAYDIESGKLEPIQSEAINELHGVTMTIAKSGDELFLTSTDDSYGYYQTIKYSLSEKKVTSSAKIAPKDFISDGYRPKGFSAINNRLYMMFAEWDGAANSPITAATIAVADLDNGEIVYKGTVSRKDGQELGKMKVEYFEIR